MAKTVDDRVVSASFETSKFEAGTQRMLSSIDKLKKSMDFKNAGKGLDQINASANRLNLSHISSGIDELNSKFKTLRLVGIAALAGLATKAASAGAQFVKQFTFAPVIDGLHEYENQINSVQTILANTRDQGTNLKQVNAALNQLNHYADKTIYNFGQMTKNIGTFTAAGVDLKTSVSSIKGIANLAAVSGSSSEQASRAMYQLSQAIAAGRVSLQDWNSVVYAGMGGAVLQKALARTAESMGTIKKGAFEIDKATGKASINGQTFRESIMAKPGEKSWLTSEVLTNTLKQFSGDLTKAQLKAQGFNDAQIKAIQSQAKMALDAATKIKTFSQLMDTTKEAIGSGWAQTWQLVLGDFGEAKHMFTAIGNAIGNMVNASANARNKVLKDWKALGGRKILIDSLKTAFQDLGAILKPIKDAFRDVFPKRTGKDLFEITKRLHNLTEALKPSKETIKNLHSTFRGLFAILDIGKMVVGGIFSVIAKLFGVVGSGSGGILKLTGSWGDWVYALDQSLKKTGAINKFFGNLGTILQKPIIFLKELAHQFASAFSGDTIGKASAAMSPLEKIIEGVNRAWDKFIESISGAPDVVKPALEGISQMYGAIGQTIADALKGADFDAVFKVLEVGLLGGIFLVLKKGFGPGLGNALSGGVLQGLGQALTGLGGLSKAGAGALNAYTGQLQAMQTKLKSEALRNLAIAIALISASIIGLSLVDPKKLNGAMSAITIAMGELLGAMAIMDKIGSSAGMVKMPIIAASMIALAVAIDVLAVAVFALSRLSWEQLAKGLGAVAVLLGAISAASVPLSANAAGMIRASIGINGIAIAMLILSQAVKTFGGMNMETLAKGIGGIAVALVGIGAAANLFPSGMVAIGVGLIAIGAGLKLITTSVANLGAMDMKTLGKGIGAIALALAGIGLAMQLMPGPSMVVTAAGLLLVSVSLGKIAAAIKSFGSMSITEIAKGIGTLAASLALLALGLIAMSGSLGGAAALTVAAAGIAILAPALKSLGDQSWGKIIKGLVALGAAFVLLGVAGVVLAPVAPAILALGVALIAVGAGLALAGAGVALLGIGLSAIAVAGPAAIRIMVDALVQLAEALPKVIAGLVKALLQLVQSVAKAAPQFVKAIGKIIALMAQAIVVAAPQLTKAFIAILELVFTVLRKEFPNLVKTGFSMLKALLKGITNNIGAVVKMVANIVGKFLGAVANNLGKIVTGGAQILAAILKGIASGLGKVITAAASIITNFLRGIANNISKIARAGVDVLTKWLKAIADGATKIISAGTTVIVKFVKGIGDAASKVGTAALKTVTKFITTIAKQLPKEADKVATAVIDMINEMANVVEKREPEFIDAVSNLGVAIVEGLITGIWSQGKKLADSVIHFAKKFIPWPVRKALGIKSPSTVMAEIGKNIVLGIASGIKANSKSLRPAMTDTVKTMLGAFGDAFSAKADVLIHDRIKKLGSDTIRLLYGIGVDGTTAMLDGMLSGIVDANTEPVQEAFDNILSTIKSSISDTENAIEGDKANIRQAFKDITADNAAYAKAKKDKDREGKLSALESKKQHQEELEAAKKSWAANKDLLSLLKENSTFILKDKSLQKQKKELQEQHDLWAQYNKQLEDAKQNLEDLKAFEKGIFDQFSAMPGLVTEDADGNPIDPDVQVQNYINSLSNADDVVGKFTGTLDTLAGMGLNKDTYNQLLDIGPAAQGFADALVQLGPAGVAGINAADTDLRNAADVLADHAGKKMFGVGVAVAQGIIDGIEANKLKVIGKAIELASAIVYAIRHKLKIRSPSQVFAEIGSLSMEGMALGFEKSSKVVTDAVYGVSEEAVAAMKKSMSGISDVVNASIDPNPTITPVLDLSQIHTGAKQMGSILSVPTTSVMLASGISVGPVDEDLSQIGQAAPIQFVQNNHSPKSLSEIEIYRQTKNQLSQARPVLAP